MISKLVTKSILKPVLSYNINWLSLLFGVAAIGVGGLVSLLVVNDVSNLYLFAIVGVFAGGTVLVLRPQWGLKALAHPEWSLLILVFIVYTRFSDVMIKYHGTPSITQPYIALLVFIILARKLLFNKQPTGWKPITTFIVIYGLLGLASLLYAIDTDSVKKTLADFAKDGIIAIIVVILLQRAVTLRRVVWVLLTAGIFMGTIAVYQQLTGTFDNEYWGFAQSPLMHIAGEAREHRVGGPFGHPNGFSRFMLVLVPPALDRLWGEKKRSLRLLAAWATGVIILTIIFSFSRGAFITLALILIVTLILRRPSLVTLLITIVFATFLLRYVPAQYTDRIETLLFFLPGSEAELEEEASFRSRLSVNIAGRMMFADHPFIGVGLSNFSARYWEYGRRIGLDRTLAKLESNAPHNIYLHIASEQGLLGLAWLGALNWALFYGLRQAQKDFIAAGKPDYANMVIAIGLGISTLYITGLFANFVRLRHYWLLWGIAFAIPVIAKRELMSASSPKDNSTDRQLSFID